MAYTRYGLEVKMMTNAKVAVVTSSSSAFPLVELLQNSHLLAGVVLLGNWDQERQLINEQLKIAGIQVHYASPENADTALSTLSAWRVSLGIVFCCGEKVPPSLVQAPEYGMVNIHASALPEYRGVQPVYWQIRNGETKTQLTAHMIDDGLDTGPIVAQIPVGIGPYDSHHFVFEKIYRKLPHLLNAVLEPIAQGCHLEGVPQNDIFVHSAPRITEQDLLIDWAHATAYKVCNQVRAGNPHLGGVSIKIGQHNVQLLQASPSRFLSENMEPGKIIHLSCERGLIVALKDESLRLDIVGNTEGVFDGYRFSQVYGLVVGDRVY